MTDVSPENAVAQRALEVRNELGLSQKAMAEKLGISPRNWQGMEGGRNIPNGETLLNFQKLGINPGWILSGLGPKKLDDPMIAPSAPITVEPATVQQLVDTVGSLSQNLGSMARRLEPPPPPPVTIKYYSVQASAGGGAAVLYESQGVDMDIQSLAIDLLHIKPKHAGLLRIKGDSMLNTLAEGDVAVMDRSDRDPEDGGLYVVSIGGEVFVKRAKWVGLAHLQWCSDNPVYDPIEVRNGDLNHMNVIGRVVWVWHNVR